MWVIFLICPPRQLQIIVYTFQTILHFSNTHLIKLKHIQIKYLVRCLKINIYIIYIILIYVILAVLGEKNNLVEVIVHHVYKNWIC
jgi:hypothetical protein